MAFQPKPLNPDDYGDFTRARFYAGETIYTDGMSGNHFYLIKEGEVDIFLVRDERKVTVETLGPGQCFGISLGDANARRFQNAAARTFCEVYVIGADVLARDLGATPSLAQNLFASLLQRLAAAHEVVAARVNFLPDVLLYAHLLQLLGRTEADRIRSVAARMVEPPKQASVPLSDVVASARALFGHSDVHIKKALSRLITLHLVRVSDDAPGGKQIIFSPRDVVMRAKRAVEGHVDSGKQDFQYLNVDEFAELVDVDRDTLLKKLVRSEFADDIFAFRKSEIIRLLDTKGRKYFAERRLKSPAEFSDIEDLEFADQKTLFAALATIDPFELAKALSGDVSPAVKEKMLGALSRVRRQEVEHELSDLNPPDTIEVQRIRGRIVPDVKRRMGGG